MTYILDVLVDLDHALLAGLSVPGHHLDEALGLLVVALRLLGVNLDFASVEFDFVHLRTNRLVSGTRQEAARATRLRRNRAVRPGRGARYLRT